ncbi:MAG: hypothetical protein JHC55_00715 [Mycolicibacterium sp.]|nr:hypothetical protein [Mycolicibacterium sp.]
MPVSRANVEATKAFIRARLGNPYVYGGALSNNVKQGTDCSEVWQTVLEMAHGRWKQGRQSEGATTESYRYVPVGGVGPFGTIRVAHWRDIPANAAAKLAFHHGPGGGANSHMWGELDGMLIESAGSKGLCTNGRARPIEDGYAHAWAYLPGPIDGPDAPPAPLVMGSVGPAVADLQRRLNLEGAGLEVDGDYGQKTAEAVAAADRRARYARLVLAEGQRRGITRRGIEIAFSVVFVESGWKMYANSKVPESLAIPHDAVGSDYDSVGLFQQRCPMWGPAHVLMDPTKSAGLFYDRLVRLSYNDSGRLPGDFAAEIQRPAAQYRGRYQERMGHAIALYDRITRPAPQSTDPWEELLMAEPVESWSIYAKDGEPKIPPIDLLRAIDAKVHRDLTDDDARRGDPIAIQNVARTAAGQGKYRNPGAIAHATRVLNEINATNPDFIRAATPGKA